MNKPNPTKYELAIQSRSTLRFVVGIYPRLRNYLKNSFIVWVARRNGAQVGEGVTMPYALARIANSNLSIGNNTSIQSSQIDVRAKVLIGSNVIIGSEVCIITVSHNIDSVNWEQRHYGIEIEDYCWLATRALVLPSCTKISYGAVCAAGSVVARDVGRMQVMAGNPAKSLRDRKTAHTDLCVESQLGNDLLPYLRAYSNRTKKNIKKQ